jgi:hypothetical protein
VSYATIDPRPLGSRPRRIAFVSTTDGRRYEFLDDGGAVTSDGFFPNSHRQQLERLLKKTHAGPARKKPSHERMPTYILVDRVPGISLEDPLNAHPCLTESPELAALVEKGAKAREMFLSAARPQIDAIRSVESPKQAAKKPAPKGQTGFMAAQGEA